MIYKIFDKTGHFQKHLISHSQSFKGKIIWKFLLRDNNVEQAIRVFKKKMQREGVFREVKLRNSYEKPSEKKAREKSEAIRRARKLSRKRAMREGLIPMKKQSSFRDF